MVQALLAVLLLAAPDPAASQAPPVFSSGTELVTVDVVVVGRDGQPLGGLARSDFQVKEDGQPREIVSFEEVRATAPSVPTAAGAPASPRATVSANTSSVPARTFVIVLDEWH